MEENGSYLRVVRALYLIRLSYIINNIVLLNQSPGLYLVFHLFSGQSYHCSVICCVAVPSLRLRTFDEDASHGPFCLPFRIQHIYGRGTAEATGMVRVMPLDCVTRCSAWRRDT